MLVRNMNAKSAAPATTRRLQTNQPAVGPANSFPKLEDIPTTQSSSGRSIILVDEWTRANGEKPRYSGVSKQKG